MDFSGSPEIQFLLHARIGGHLGEAAFASGVIGEMLLP
jgi:hypothetical protein